MRVNRIRDFVERVGWTFVQAYIGLGAIDWLTNGLNSDLVHQFYAASGAATVATIKVLVAQRFGNRGSGDAIPGGVTKTP